MPDTDGVSSRPAHYRYRVVDGDEIALLLAVGDAVAVRFE
jgi:hypothetical protein